MSTPEAFEAALADLAGDVVGLLDEAERELERRTSWRRWMKFEYASRTWWMRRTNLRVLVFMRRGDDQALCQRWHE